MYIYVIEMILNDEVTTSHIFLTHTSAYRKFIELVGLHYDSEDVRSVFLIERELNDQSGQFSDKLIDKMDSLRSIDDIPTQNVNLHC